MQALAATAAVVGASRFIGTARPSRAHGRAGTAPAGRGRGIVGFRQVPAFQPGEDPAPRAVHAVLRLPGGLLLGRLLRPLITVVWHEVERKGSETVLQVS